MAVFFIDTGTGQVATERQLLVASVMEPGDAPPKPWFRIQGTRDASTMWYAVLRKKVRGVYIGTIAIRHGDHHASLMQDGWHDVAIEEIGSSLAAGPQPESRTQAM